MLLLEIIEDILPIILLMVLGYFLREKKFIDDGLNKNLAFLVMNIALPALMFLSVAQRPLTEVANPTYLLAYAITSVVVLVAAYLWSRRMNRTPRAAAAFDALGAGGANSGFVGFPLLLVVMPSVAGVVFGMNVIVESLITVPLCFFWAERGEDATGLLRSIRALRT